MSQPSQFSINFIQSATNEREVRVSIMQSGLLMLVWEIILLHSAGTTCHLEYQQKALGRENYSHNIRLQHQGYRKKIHTDPVENFFFIITFDIRGNYSEQSACPCFDPLPFLSQCSSECDQIYWTLGILDPIGIGECHDPTLFFFSSHLCQVLCF